MDDGAAGLDPYLAPILLPVLAGQEPTSPGIGALGLSDGQLLVDPDRPTVYHDEGRVLVGEEEHRQLTFLWFGAGGESPRVQGVRVTCDREGLPAIFELLADGEGRTLLFVTRGLEEASRASHGEPLEGREHACEPGLELRPDVLVPALVAHSPEALGPMVYLTEACDEVLGLHCRCEPARLQAIRQTVEYELRPLTSLDPEVVEALERWLGPERVFPAPDWPLVSLRLPATF